MELAISVTIRPFLLHLYCASEFEALGHAGVSLGESLQGVPNDELRTRLWLVVHKLPLSRQITVAVDVSVRIRATIKQVGKQVPLVVLRAESIRALLLLHGVHLKTNRQVYGHAYVTINYQEHLVKFKADAAIEHVAQGSTIVHAYVIFVLKALDVGARHVVCYSYVPHIHRVVHSWDGLGCVAHGERVHLRAQADELDDWNAFGLVLEVAHLSGM